MCCFIFTTPCDDDDHTVRQVLSSRDLLAQHEAALDAEEHEQDFSAIPMEARQYLLVFLRVADWARACDILDACPLLVAPWASNFLRAVLREVRFSAADVAACSAHIIVLDMARSLGVEQTRAILTHPIA